MTSLGTATQVGQPALSTVSAFIPTVPGTPLGAITLISFTGTTTVVPTTGITWPRTR